MAVQPSPSDEVPSPVSGPLPQAGPLWGNVCDEPPSPLIKALLAVWALRSPRGTREKMANSPRIA